MKTSKADTIVRITIEGGVVQNVDFLKALGKVRVQIMDFDTDGVDEPLTKNAKGEAYIESIYEHIPKEPSGAGISIVGGKNIA